MTRPEGSLHRAPRPLIAWTGVLTAACSLAFLVLLAIPILRAVNRWADGEPVDWQGFAFIITAAGGAATTILGPLAQYLQNRSRERRDEIAFGGGAPRPPTNPLPPSGQQPDDIPGGGLVNNEALQ